MGAGAGVGPGGEAAAEVLRARWYWWVRGRWKNDRDLSLLRRTRDTRRSRLADGGGGGGFGGGGAPKPRFEFWPGEVDVLEHTNGSGALLEVRVGELVVSLNACMHEVGELSQKLQEIEVPSRRHALALPSQPAVRSAPPLSRVTSTATPPRPRPVRRWLSRARPRTTASRW